MDPLNLKVGVKSGEQVVVETRVEDLQGNTLHILSKIPIIVHPDDMEDHTGE